MFNRKTIANFTNNEKRSALALEHCLAKTYKSKNNTRCKGRTVLEHCLIVGEIARSLIKRIPNQLQFLFPQDAELIAAAHDVGKVSPTFQEKIYRSIPDYIHNSFPELVNVNPDLEYQWGYHAGVSQLAVKHCISGEFIPSILGQHHGYSPDVSKYKAIDPIFGGESWQKRREELLNELKTQLKCSSWPEVKDPLQALVLSGLTTVADWIASSSQFDIPSKEWRSLVEESLDQAGFTKPKLKSNLSFSDIFEFAPRDIQAQLILSCENPGIYILEAPMGSGKTEAALYAAYKMMAANKATGIYFALPTQLTSDKIHDRTNHFLKQVLTEDNHSAHALLLHSNAWLRDTEMGEEGQPGGSWFQANKRGILAPFAVGTIDQALMAVMNVKHGFVRTFGLAGKVVILDEVHTYDSYTGTILNQLIGSLVKLRCTVIILSATLTQDRRKEILTQSIPASQEHKSFEYPLISALPSSGELQEISITALEDAEIAIKSCHKDELAFEEALSRAEQGQYILWIENTVDEAQAAYKLLAAKSKDLGVSCALLHSRFLKHDRNLIEETWIHLFGKDSRKTKRPQGHILVGTQVLEQSLDIDADFIISRMCPTDMLLQRLGRLWRHKETIRAESASREAWILAPILNLTKCDSKKDFGKTALVYAVYVLYRSLEIWSKLDSIRLPSSIRPLIEATYQEREESGKMNTFKRDLAEKKETLRSMAAIGLSRAGTTLSENKASTRYSEQDSVEVLLFRSCRHNEKGTDLILLNGDLIHLPKNSKKLKKQEWRQLAITLLNNTVKVAEYLAPNPSPTQNLHWLQDYLYIGNKEHHESLLRVAEVRNSGELGSHHSEYELSYNSVLGYQAKKRDKQNEHNKSLQFD